MASHAPGLNLPSFGRLPAREDARSALSPLLELDAVVAEGPGGFLWTSLLRAQGFEGRIAILPYLNPCRWYDVASASAYLPFASPRDRVFLGSTPSARIYRGLGVPARVGEPYGIDGDRFRSRPEPSSIREERSIPRGRRLVLAGRAEPDKDLYSLLRVGLRRAFCFRICSSSSRATWWTKST